MGWRPLCGKYLFHHCKCKGSQFSRKPKSNNRQFSSVECEWLTEEQVDAMKDLLEKELRNEGNTEGREGRQKRQIVEFRISTHLKWDRVIPYKFDGNHSKNSFY